MRRPETVAAPSGARRVFPRADIVRVPYDPRRREALAAFSEAHRPSPYVRLPVRRLLGGLAPPDWRGARLGDIVLAEAMRLLVARGAARLRLGVTATNAPALALYRRAGFSVVEAWRGWRLALGEDR